MANKDLFKQAIAEAKSVREAAIANAKEALEETLTPHLKDLLAAKLQEMEDSQNEEEVVNEVEEEVEESAETQEEVVAEGDGLESVTAEAEEDEAEDDSEESDDEAEAEIEDAGEEMEAEEEEAIDGDEDISKLTVDQFKDMIRDIIAQEVGAGEPDGDELGADMDGGDIEGLGDEAPAIEEPALDGAEDEEEIDLDELIRELEGVKEEEVTEEEVTEDTEVQVPADAEAPGKNINRTVKEEVVEESNELAEALETIESLRKELSEVNILNSKLLYVNKIFKANNLSEAQKVNIIAAFDKAETVKEVKLVFETVSENIVNVKKENVTESKVKGMASKATGTTASKPEVIAEVSDAVRRMQKLAGIIK
jgi:hypothetical protein